MLKQKVPRTIHPWCGPDALGMQCHKHQGEQPHSNTDTAREQHLLQNTPLCKAASTALCTHLDQIQSVPSHTKEQQPQSLFDRKRQHTTSLKTRRTGATKWGMQTNELVLTSDSGTMGGEACHGIAH